MSAVGPRSTDEPDPDDRFDPGGSPLTDGAGPADFGDLLLDRESMRSVLQKVAERAVQVVPGATEGSVTLVERGRATSASRTGLLAFELDEVQVGLEVGPGLDAARSGLVQTVSDLRVEQRWARFCELAVRQGARSAMSTPIPIEQHDLQAALNLYSTAAGAFDDEATRSTAGSLAGRAAVAITNMLSFDRTRRAVSDLETAMASRAAIEQAKGILMGRHHVSSEEAFQMLSADSQSANRKLRDLAAELVASCSPPG